MIYSIEYIRTNAAKVCKHIRKNLKLSESGITQAQFASLLRADVMTISRWERAVSEKPNHEYAELLRLFYEIAMRQSDPVLVQTVEFTNRVEDLRRVFLSTDCFNSDAALVMADALAQLELYERTGEPTYKPENEKLARIGRAIEKTVLES